MNKTAPIVCLALAVALPRAAAGQGVDLESIGYTLGAESAPVVVVEFGDFACGACGEFWRTTWPTVRSELIETGRVSWRHVPFLLGFDRGEEGANAAECAADQGAFWPMHDLLFERQSEWLRIRRPHEAFLRYSEELGLDASAFEECYDDEAGEDRTRAATQAARRAGVRGTPTFFVNGEPAVGALSYDQLVALVERAAAPR